MSDPADNTFESKGFVYVLSTKAIPDLLKIGFSLKHPAIRAQELSGSGMPHPYRVEYCAFLNNPYETEQAIHGALAHKHEAKEFFRISAEEAILAISTVIRGTGHEILYEEGDLKARSLEKKQAEEKALALAEERRKKWWLKCAPKKAFTMPGFEPIVQGVEELITRVDTRERTQDLTQVFSVLKRLRMPEGYVLGWGCYDYKFDSTAWLLGKDKVGLGFVQTNREIWFFSRKATQQRPESIDSVRELPESQTKFPFGIQVIGPSMERPDQELPWQTIWSYVELAIFDLLRHAFVGDRRVFVICGESSLRRRINEEEYFDSSELDQARQLNFDPRVVISCETDVPTISVEFVCYRQNVLGEYVDGGSWINRESIIFSLEKPLLVLGSERKELIRSRKTSCVWPNYSAGYTTIKN